LEALPAARVSVIEAFAGWSCATTQARFGSSRAGGNGRTSWLAVTEIREYGSEAIQVLRRLRALLLELYDTVLPEHREAIEAELERLAVTVELSFGDSVDFDRAAIPDRQGIGGPTASARLEQERFLPASRP
jgi:hypothetical protein